VGRMTKGQEEALGVLPVCLSGCSDDVTGLSTYQSFLNCVL
jgi:hypothetical protein